MNDNINKSLWFLPLVIVFGLFSVKSYAAGNAITDCETCKALAGSGCLYAGVGCQPQGGDRLVSITGRDREIALIELVYIWQGPYPSLLNSEGKRVKINTEAMMAQSGFLLSDDARCIWAARNGQKVKCASGSGTIIQTAILGAKKHKPGSNAHNTLLGVIAQRLEKAGLTFHPHALAIAKQQPEKCCG